MNTKINDFAVMISTVNGSGSQSANQILMRSIHHMGIPVGGKNLFPSNIAGLPTWFWIRANENWFIGKAAEADIFISMNPNTLMEDVKQVKQGGVFIYNQEGFIFPSDFRPDLVKIPLPCKALVEGTTDSGKAKKMLQNVVYVGAISALLGLDEEACHQAIKDQFGDKTNFLESNSKALSNGRNHILNLADKPKFTYKVEKRNLTEDHFFIDGNTAGGLGMVMGGFQFCAWYPITPSTSMIEAVEKFAPHLRPHPEGKNNFAIVQAEDELSAVSMIIGAGWAGARNFTSTSGPGVSLMQETAGLSYYCDIPAVIWNVQRTGPSTGLPTRTMQGDILLCVYASHGDTLFPCLFPSNMEECYEFAQVSLDLSERLQQLIFVLSDLDLGMNLWLSPRFKYNDKPFDRGKVLHKEEADALNNYERFGDPDGDGIPYRILPGEGSSKWAYLTRGSGHNAKTLYSESPSDYKFQMDRLARKWETAKKLVPKPVVDSKGHKVGLLAFGSTDLAISESRHLLKQKRLETDYLRLKALPITSEVNDFLKNHDRIYIIEQNRDGQMFKVFQNEAPEWASKMRSIKYYESIPISAQFISEAISSLEKKESL